MIMMDCLMRVKIVLLMMSTLSFVTACMPHRPAVRPESIPNSATGHDLHGRFIDLQAGRFISFESLLDAVVQAQVIAVGEEHYQPDIQAFELRLLRALATRRPHRLALSMEFLERDQQATVDAYLAREIDRQTLQQRLHASPAFVRYYVPLLREARQLGIPVIAMNTPRRIARQVAQQGWQKTRQDLNATERHYLPASLAPISAVYRNYFLDAVAGSHPLTEDQVAHFTTASYLKDATMAAALAAFVQQHPTFIILAVAGRFHVDYGIAIPALLRQSMPNIGMRRITVMAVAPQQTVDLHRLARDHLADYLYIVPPAPHEVGLVEAFQGLGNAVEIR